MNWWSRTAMSVTRSRRGPPRRSAARSRPRASWSGASTRRSVRPAQGSRGPASGRRRPERDQEARRAADRHRGASPRASSAGSASGVLWPATRKSCVVSYVGAELVRRLVAQPVGAGGQRRQLELRLALRVVRERAARPLARRPASRAAPPRAAYAVSQRGRRLSPGVAIRIAASLARAGSGLVGRQQRLRRGCDERDQPPAARRPARGVAVEVGARDRDAPPGALAEERRVSASTLRLDRDEAQAEAALGRARLAALVGDVRRRPRSGR